MSTRLRDVLMRELGGLRHEPTDKRIRAVLGDATIIDSTRALLVWEPKRVVPSYAVPEDDVDAQIGPAASAGPDGVPAADPPMLGQRPVYDPSVPFAIHTAEGEAVLLTDAATGRTVDAFRPVDEALARHVIVDFAGFDAWYEEDERNVSHPRDPFHRIDIVHSSRHVRVERDGVVLAESTRPVMLFEPPLPVRYYLAPEDVRMDLLAASEEHTACAYKGQASYWSLADEPDVAWSYPAPLREAAEVTDHIAFFDERVDVVVDGVRIERPVTPWSR